MAIRDKKVNIVIQVKDLATKKFAGLKKSLLSLKGVVIGGLGFLGLAKLFNTVTKAAGTQEDAVNALNTQLKINGELTDEISNLLQKQASEIQRVTKFGDEEVLMLQAQLLSYGMLAKDIDKTTRLTLDLAAAKRIDLKAAADLVGKAFVGETGSLSRYGIILDSNIKKTEKFAAVQKLIEQRFGGTAQAQAKTYTGIVKQMKNAFGDTVEALGRFITKSEAVRSVISTMIPILKSVTDWLDNHRRASAFATEATETFTDALYGQRKALDEIMNLKAVAALEAELTRLEKRQVAYTSKTKETVEAFKLVISLRDELGLEEAAKKILDADSFSKETKIIVKNMVRLNQIKSELDDAVERETKKRVLASIKREKDKNKEINKDDEVTANDRLSRHKQLQADLNSLRDTELEALKRWHSEESELNKGSKANLLLIDQIYVEKKDTLNKEFAEKAKKLTDDAEAAELERLMASFENMQKEALAIKEFLDKKDALINESTRKEIDARRRVAQTLAGMQANTLRKALEGDNLNWSERKLLLAEQGEKAQQLFDKLSSGEKMTAIEVERVIQKIKEQKEALSDVEGVEDTIKILNAAQEKVFDIFKTIESSPIVPKIDFSDAIIQARLGGKRLSQAMRASFDADQASTPLIPKLKSSILNVGD